MRLIQLNSELSGEPIGLYTCSKTTEELSENEVKEIMAEFHSLNDEGDYEDADRLISENGIERIYVDEEIYVD